ncbi:MAG TPA: MarR family transcriptional regulator [Actinoplanes sp.]|nr:MarR family transcriptional regulator [Actinoplanes sp.]
MRAPPADDNLSDLFGSVARSLRRRTRTALEPLGITPSLSRALGVLDRLAPIRVSVLADHLHIAPRTATELIDDLESRRLAGRRPDPGDRRAVLVQLTEAGEKAAREIRAARAAEGERFFAALDPADRRDLVRILGKLGD